jgi:hypothetical protein
MAAMVLFALAAGAEAQPFNSEKAVEPPTGDAQPLGGAEDADRASPPAAAPAAAAEPAPVPAGVTAKPAPGVQWAEHVSPSFRRWIGGDQAEPSGEASATPNAAPETATIPAPGVQWAEHVSPSFRRWAAGDRTPPSTPDLSDPTVRNRPGPDQRGSNLSTVENAIDKPPPATPDAGGVGADTQFLKRVSRAHARAIVGPEGALMGAELADGISMAPFTRNRVKAGARLPEHGALPKRTPLSVAEDGPLQDIPGEIRYDGTPLYNADAAPDEPTQDKAVVIALARGDVAGMDLGDKVSVVHVSQFAKGERPEGGSFVIYPRSRFRPWGPINSFETVNSFQAINVEPLQSAEDPSDPSPVARSAYAIGNWDLPGDVLLPLADKSMYERREWFIRHLHDCCGPAAVSVMHDPLALVIHYNSIHFVPGQVPAIVPLAPGMPAW